jgi:serine/threonine protein kinase
MQNIIQLLAVCREPPELALVTQLCARGSLYGLLHNPAVAGLRLRQLLAVWLGVAQGMTHLHALRPPVMHRGEPPQSS